LLNPNVSPELRVRLFGAPSFEVDGAPVSVAVRPLCAVLFAMILLAEPHRRLSRKAVAVDLWPDETEEMAAANLRRHLSFLTAALPAADAYIGRDRESLWSRAAAGLWCDVIEFERGDIDLYRADFMEGSPHEWVVAERERLRAVAFERLLQRAERLREASDDAGAIASARRAAEIEPCSEEAAQLEIELHGERGDLAALDAAYAAFERRLREIDAKPSAETRALAERFHRLAQEAAERIPRTSTSFVDTGSRDEVAALVAAHRLVTLVGPGGAGKTRLALEVAHRIAASFADGAYFADLSTVSEGDALADALSRTLRVPTELASKGFAGVKTMLRNRRALLVLDNCEQILDSCSWLVSSLLDDAPDVRILATSRAAFGLSAERCYVLRPLTPEHAARLFLERARSTGWDGSGLAEADTRVASVCERLDRLPLALELAAGMLGTLSLANVEEQIRERLDQIESRDPTTPARHRSLSDVIRWSVGLLGEDARTAFVRLAVFSGSFSAAAAKAICSVDLGTLAALVATSVLVRDDALESRFVYLNGVGDYARRLFDADPEAPALRDAHAAWYAALAARSQEPAFCKSERAWLRDIDRDFANVVRALEWSLLSGGDSQNGLKLAIGAGLYFLRRGFLLDGVSWLETALGRTLPDSAERAHLEMQLSQLEVPRANFARALERARAARTYFEAFGPDRDLGRALNCEGFTLIYVGRAAEARSVFERALPPAQRSADIRIEAHNLSNIAYLLSESQPAEAQRLYLRALRRYTDAGDDLNIAKTHNSLAAFEYTAGRYEAANEHLERALAMHRDYGNAPAIAGTVADLGDVALMQGFTSRARDYYAEALRFLERLEEVLSYATLLCGIAGIAADTNRPRDAARLIGAARFSDNGTPAPARVRVRTHVLARVEAALGPEACALEIALGSELPLTEAVRLARSVLESRPA
jgi:predicted ATPase/DNA-binding SARP family transcriptional activator/Tfp pilus assembly protein PilF